MSELPHAHDQKSPDSCGEQPSPTVPMTTLLHNSVIDPGAADLPRILTRIELLDVPGYELIREVGRGGMGVVYHARHLRLNRDVALKVILAGKHASDNDLMRFRAEAEAAAQLQHPGIVQIYEISEHDSVPYLALEFCPGGSLADQLRGTPLPGRQAAGIVQQLAKAVHAAHQQHIIHRDLKPANVLLTSDGQVKISDFGLAKRLASSDKPAENLTQTGVIMGTPSYMAPEQASPQTRQVGPAADVYALGAILYECLTGRPPFRAATAMDTLMQVVSDDPVPPRLLNPKIDPDLETICLKCLEKEPDNRYPSAAEVALDLQRYFDGDSISARSFNVLDRLARVLDRSQHDAALHTWSSILFILAAIIATGHFLVFLFAQLGQPNEVLTATRIGQFLLLGVVFWFNRGKQVWPRTSAERELWTIWIAYLLAYGTISVTLHLLIEGQFIVAGPGVPAQWENLLLYPISSVLAGMAFFVMGSNYWGRCYAIGAGFMLLAMAATFFVELAPLLFGILWGVTLACVGLRLRWLGAQRAGIVESE